MPCEFCECGTVLCSSCEDDTLERALVSVLGVTVLADDLLSCVRRQTDVFPLVVDDGKVWLPRSQPIEPFVEGQYDKIVAHGAYRHEQIPLPIFGKRQ